MINHKGQPCIWEKTKKLPCQEGFCDECEIYLRRLKKPKKGKGGDAQQ